MKISTVKLSGFMGYSLVGDGRKDSGVLVYFSFRYGPLKYVFKLSCHVNNRTGFLILKNNATKQNNILFLLIYIDTI